MNNVVIVDSTDIEEVNNLITLGYKLIKTYQKDNDLHFVMQIECVICNGTGMMPVTFQDAHGSVKISQEPCEGNHASFDSDMPMR